MNNNRNEKGQFVLGNNASEKIWESVEDLQKDIDAYFNECDNAILGHDNQGKPIREPYTIEGLALALKCSYQTLLNYEKKEGYEPYFETIKNAKLRVQKQKVVNGLIGKTNATITIFDLKNNHGYKDKTEVEQTNVDHTPTKYVILTNDSDTNTSS